MAIFAVKGGVESPAEGLADALYGFVSDMQKTAWTAGNISTYMQSRRSNLQVRKCAARLTRPHRIIIDRDLLICSLVGIYRIWRRPLRV